MSHGIARSAAFLLFSATCVFAQVTIDTVAGGGTDDGIAATQSWVQPRVLFAAPDGSLYFPSDYRIRRIRPDGVLETVAGVGTSGFSGDGGPAKTAQLWFPSNVVRDSSGGLIFSDHDYRIRRIAPDGTIATIAGTGLPSGNGPSEGEALSLPVVAVSLAIDAKDNLYFLEPNRVRKISKSGTVTLVAGSSTPQDQLGDDGDGGPATAAHLTFPGYLALDQVGNIYLGDYLGLNSGSLVRKVDKDGIISTFAGTAAGPTYHGGPISDGQSASTAFFLSISSMAVDPANSLYLTGLDYQQHFGAWRLTQDGKIFSVPAVTGFILAIGGDSTIYFENGAATYALQGAQPVRLMAGSKPYTVADGTPARGAYIDPVAIATDSSDRVVFVQNGACTIRRVRSDGRIETIAGTGRCATSASAGPTLTTDIEPTRKIIGSPDGALSFLGLTNSFYRLDANGQLSVNQLPLQGAAIGADSKSNVYVASAQGNVLKVTPAGQILIFAGLVLSSPLSAMTVDSSDYIYCYTQQGRRYVINPAGTVTGPSFGLLSGVAFARIDSAGREYFISTGGQIYRLSGNTLGKWDNSTASPETEVRHNPVTTTIRRSLPLTVAEPSIFWIPEMA
jgi:hypothetical protein